MRGKNSPGRELTVDSDRDLHRSDSLRTDAQLASVESARNKPKRRAFTQPELPGWRIAVARAEEALSALRDKDLASAEPALTVH
jgi:hypothetical protein